MDDERRRILKMLAEGTISVDECEELLHALADRRERREAAEEAQARVGERPKWPYVLLVVLGLILFGTIVVGLLRSGLAGLQHLRLPFFFFGFPSGALALLLFVFWLWMIRDCLSRPVYDFRLLFTQNRQYEKWIWIGIVFLTGWVGALAYFFVIRRPARSIAPVVEPPRHPRPTPTEREAAYVPGPRARSLLWLVVLTLVIAGLIWIVVALGSSGFHRDLLVGPLGRPSLIRHGHVPQAVAAPFVASLMFLVIHGTVFWFAMLISCLVRDHREFGTIIPSDPAADKLLWLFIILFTWVIGAIAYHISIRRRVREPSTLAT